MLATYVTKCQEIHINVFCKLIVIDSWMRLTLTKFKSDHQHRLRILHQLPEAIDTITVSKCVAWYNCILSSCLAVYMRRLRMIKFLTIYIIYIFYMLPTYPTDIAKSAFAQKCELCKSQKNSIEKNKLM